ncbi:MAG: T9SS type A sorting domain-containing protein [candidate division Zixibacteria bacterium]|nr:T9SS type A sorting domain-containing protein [candidate division Zixibacteria bacterium]
MRTILLLLTLTLTAYNIVLADPDTLWTRQFGGADDEWAMSVDRTDDGGYIIAGSTLSFGAGLTDIYFVKTDEFGDLQWSKTYGGSHLDDANKVLNGPNGGYIIAGSTVSFGPGNYSSWVLGTDSQGDTLWTRVYGISMLDKITDADYSVDGAYIFAGWEESIELGMQYRLLKTNSVGDTFWTRTYGGTYDEYAYAVEETEDGGYILAGTGVNTIGNPTVNGYIIKTDANGDTIWTTYVPPWYEDNECYSIRQTADGGYITAGQMGTSLYLVKFTPEGEDEWRKAVGETNLASRAYCVCQTADGGYIAVGSTGAILGLKWVYIVRTNARGDLLWKRKYYASSDEVKLSEILVIGEGNYITAGIAPGRDMLLMKIREPIYCCEMEITPDDDPVIVQPGGSFSYQGTLINPSTETLISDVWVGVIYDGEFFQTRLFEATDSLQSGEFVTRHLTQNVPNYAPEGDYRYMAYGGAYPYPCDSVWFDFTVEGAPLADGNSKWNVEELYAGAGEDISKNWSPTLQLDGSPNPFNASTRIDYRISESGRTKLEIFDIMGRRVEVLVDEHKDAGSHSVIWNAENYPSGIYFCKLTQGPLKVTKKMGLVK